MAFLNVFKKKSKEKPKEKKVSKKKPSPKKEEVKIESPKAKKALSPREARMVKFPHITEKSSRLAQENKYVFRVEGWVNKNEAKKAVEKIYGVDVKGVSIVNIPSKKRRLGKYSGWKKGFKKAIVKVKKGQKIEIMPH